MKTVGPLNVAVEKGRLFDYFEELKDIIKQATADVMFVDPYLDDQFISRYLPHVKPGVTIRLLTSPVEKLAIRANFSLRWIYSLRKIASP